jgi:hypothetical protein
MKYSELKNVLFLLLILLKDCFKHEDDDALSSYEEKSLDMLKDEDDQNMYSEESSCNEDQDILQENNTLQKGDEESIEEKDCEVLFTGDLSQVKEVLFFVT